MFCYQCEQTAKGQGCSQIGVCGKDDNTATLQDLLVHALKGVSMFAHRAAQLGARDASIDEFVVEALFATLTNVNFDPVRVAALIEQTARLATAPASCIWSQPPPRGATGAVQWGQQVQARGKPRWSDLAGKSYSIPAASQNNGSEVANLQELILYGIKGVAAYAEHARQVGGTDAGIYATIHEVLDFLTRPRPRSTSCWATR